jgi:transposase
LKTAKKLFEYKNVELLPWTNRSPGPNPIETLWAIIKLKATKMGPRTIEVFKNSIIKAYKSNDKFVCEELA